MTIHPDLQAVLSGERRWCVVTGDCLPMLGCLRPHVHALVTDPPYGIDHKSNGQLFRGDRPCVGDSTTALAERVVFWAAGSDLDGPCLPTVCFFSPYQPLRSVHWRSVLVWNKGPQVGIGGDRKTCWKRDHELIGVRGNRPLNGKRDSSVLDYPSAVRKPSGHFCEKPVALMEYLVEKVTQPDEVVFDPFTGSGTTGVAAIKTGRRFIGIEIDDKYAEIARGRIAKAEAEIGAAA